MIAPKSEMRLKVLAWLEAERQGHQDVKFDGPMRAHDDQALKDEGVGPDSFWRDQINQYIHRAHVFGLETPLGKQALMKAAATALGCCEAMWRVYGPPPVPGVPSGTVEIAEEL